MNSETPRQVHVRQALRALGLALGLILVLAIGSLTVLLGTRFGQTWVLKIVSQSLTSQIGSEVRLGSFDLGWNGLRVNSIQVMGCHSDTLLTISQIDLIWRSINPLRGSVRFQSIVVEDATVFIHPQQKTNTLGAKPALSQSNWECLWQRIPKSSNRGRQSTSLSLNRVLLRKIDWQISGYPDLGGFRPRRTTNLALTRLNIKPDRWQMRVSFRHVLASTPIPFSGKGTLIGWPNGKVLARRIHLDHPELELQIPALEVNSANSIVASSTRIRMVEGHLNRWLRASNPWPAWTLHCPTLEWNGGLLTWSGLKGNVANGIDLQSSGKWQAQIPPKATPYPPGVTDTLLSLSWSLMAHSQWAPVLQRIQENWVEPLKPATKAKQIHEFLPYLPDSGTWSLQGQIRQGHFGLKAEAKISCGNSQVQVLAQKQNSTNLWAGSAQVNAYPFPQGISIGPTVAQWSLQGQNKFDVDIQSDNITWEKEKFSNLNARLQWHPNSLGCRVNLLDSLHQLESDWTALLQNGKPVSVAGHGKLNFQFPSIPELCGPIRALGEFSIRDSSEFTQIELADGALVCDQKSLEIRNARLKLDRQSSGQAIQITLNEDSIHTTGLYKFEHVPQALDQVANFLLGDTGYSFQEIPFRAYIKINKLGDYLPFFTQAPPIQCAQLKGSLNWSLPMTGSVPYWNRGIRLDIGSASWQDWAARKISIRTEYLGNTLLVQGQLDSLRKDETILFKQVNYQQIRDRLSSTLRLLGTDPLSQQPSLFHGSLTSGDAQWILGIDTLRANIANQIWTSAEGGLIRKYGDVWDLDSITLRHGDSKLMLNGLISNKPGDKIKLEISNLGLPQVMAAAGQRNRLFQGNINGQITGDGILNQPNITGNLSIPSLQLDSMVLGDLSVQSSFIPLTNRLLLKAHLDKQSKKPASVTGWLQTNDKSLPCDLQVKLKGAPLQLLELVLLPNLDSIRGEADAEIQLAGSLEKPRMKGTMALKEGRLRVPFLKNTYRITGDVRVEPNQFVFENNEIFDQDRGRAKVSGVVTHQGFRDWTYRFQMDSAKSLMVLNEPRLMNEDYYHGLGRINGSGSISGDERSTQIQVSAEAVKGSRLIIPLDDLSEENTYDFIQFKQPIGTNLPTTPSSNEQTVGIRGLEFNLGLILTPESEVSLLLDRRFGDQIKGTGHGNLNLTLSREGNLALTGNYVFEQGNYSFNLVNLVNKNFEIKKGGRIDWNGDPYAGNMQMEAVYKQRASIRNLLGNNLTGQNDNRNILPVETYLDLTGPILQPGVKFRLNLPTVNTNNPNDILVQQITRINNNEQELNSQVLGLLVSGQFIPSENLNSANLGISTGATAFNSVTEMLTTRLSNLLNNSLGGGLNFGINYRGDLGTGILNSGNNANSVADSNRRDLNLALNTSLFGNRLVIDGNLAMGNSLQVNSRNMAGEINVEYLINPSGTVRAKAFNRPDDRILFNQSQNLNYRQGIGLSYNRNFNRWSELLRKNPRQ